MQSLIVEILELDPYHKIFTDNTKAILCMIRHGLIILEIPCRRIRCNGIMKIQSTNKFSDGMGFRCRVKKCKSVFSVKMWSKFEGITIDCKKILRYLYCWLYSYTNYQAINLCQTSEPSYIKMKVIFLDILGTQNEETEEMCRLSVRVQIDETAICNGLVIIDPSNKLDDLPNIQWIVGDVVEGDCRKFFLKLVPNRRSQVLTEVFKEHIHSGSVIVTDGYPSYPQAVHDFGSMHEVVNHSLDFVTASDVNTNQIENIWSHLKQEYRGRYGLNHNRIHLFLKEFSWKKRSIVHSSADTHTVGFLSLLVKFKMFN